MASSSGNRKSISSVFQKQISRVFGGKQSSAKPPASAECSSYQYKPLKSDGSTFRLVSLKPGVGDQRIECELTEIAANSEPKYTALSYTWGDPAVTAFVWVDGRVIGIVDNLNHALLRLRDPIKTLTLWIDALCINQEDEDGEKPTQVPLMRRIYGQAESVTIYLGREEDGSEQIPALFTAIDRAYDKSGKGTTDQPWVNHGVHPSNYEILGLPPISHHIWTSARQFLCRPWFSRIWVIQEAVLAKTADVVCGDWNMEFHFMLDTVNLATVLGLPLFPYPQSDKSTYPGITAKQLILLSVLGAGTQDFTPWKYIDLLHRARYACASRQHDYCYGLLGLAKELGDPTLRVDYSLPVATVYLRLAQYFVTKGDGIKLLYNASGHSINLPSWVPDWSCRNLPTARLVPSPLAIAPVNPAWRAASGFTSSVELHPTAPDTLIVRGLVFDDLEDLGIRHPQPLINQLDQNSRIVAISECIDELSFLLDPERGLQSLTTREIDTVWRTMICNRAQNSESKAPSSYLQYFQCFLMRSMELDDAVYAEGLDGELAGLPSGEIQARANVIVQGATEFCYTQRRARTRRGFVGQFPLNSRKGDVVFLPLGSAVPFVVRQKWKGHYKLIGECYVYGIMDGEAFDVAGVSTTDIHIV